MEPRDFFVFCALYHYRTVFLGLTLSLSLFISLFIPILMFYLFFAFPDAFLDISLTLYGRLISVLLIMYYTCIHKYYGILVCLFVIFYYQMDSIEGMCKYNNNEMLTSVFIEYEIIPS